MFNVAKRNCSALYSGEPIGADTPNIYQLVKTEFNMLSFHSVYLSLSLSLSFSHTQYRPTQSRHALINMYKHSATKFVEQSSMWRKKNSMKYRASTRQQIRVHGRDRIIITKNENTSLKLRTKLCTKCNN